MLGFECVGWGDRSAIQGSSRVSRGAGRGAGGPGRGQAMPVTAVVAGTARCSLAERLPAPGAASELESSCCTHFPLSCFVSRDFLWKQSLCSCRVLLVCLFSLGNEQEQQIWRNKGLFCMQMLLKNGGNPGDKAKLFPQRNAGPGSLAIPSAVAGG